MGCSLVSCAQYCFWSCITVFSGVIGYVLLGKEKEEFQQLKDVKFWRCMIRFVYKLILQRRQGVLSLHKNLVFTAESGDGNYSLKLSTKYHKVAVKTLRFDRAHIQQYKDVCGYKAACIPVCYPETIFFNLIFHLVTSSKFALSPLGLIHVRQTITQMDMLDKFYDTDLAAEADVIKYRKGDKGVEVDIRMRLFVISRRGSIWEGVVTLLSRSASLGPRSRYRQVQDNVGGYENSGRIDVPRGIGVSYARVTGDWNPHHLFPWSARLLGYKQPIAHGMWTLAKTVNYIQSRDKSIESRESKKTFIECSFKCPMYIPGNMEIKYEPLPYIHTVKGCQVVAMESTSSLPHLIMNLRCN